MKEHYHYYVVYTDGISVGSITVVIANRKVTSKDILKFMETIKDLNEKSSKIIILNFKKIGCNCDDIN